MSRLTKQTEFVIYNPDLLDPEEKEHFVEVFDSDKDIDIDNHCTNRTLRAGQFQNVKDQKSN